MGKQHRYVGEAGASMNIIARSVEVTPFFRTVATLLGESGVNLKISGYNLEGVVHQILEDYGIEKVMEVVNNLRADGEPTYNPESEVSND